MTTQSEALRLADAMTRALEQTDAEDDVVHVTRWFVEDSRAELRRLHAENERLHQINHAHEMKLSVRGYQIQIEDLRLAHAELRERNAELLEALRVAVDSDLGRLWVWPESAKETWLTNARAAIAKAEGA
jgi:hypothetical protein